MGSLEGFEGIYPLLFLALNKDSCSPNATKSRTEKNTNFVFKFNIFSHVGSALTVTLLGMVVVKIMYGPYEAYGVIKHRFQRIRGLYDGLSDLGYEVELIEINLINRMTIELCRRKIFSCDIRNLLFNMNMEDDAVCKRAVAAVKEACARFDVDENVASFTPVSKGKRQIEELQNIKCTKELLPDLMFEHPYRWGEVH